MSLQQTVLRVKTNKPDSITITGNTSISLSGTTGVSYSGSGTTESPYIGTFPSSVSWVEVTAIGSGILYYDITLALTEISYNYLSVYVQHKGDSLPRKVFSSYAPNNNDYFRVEDGDIITFKQNFATGSGTFKFYFNGDYQSVNYTPDTYETLDLLNDIPIVINKSFAEIQDISKRNSDYSIGVKLPGSKKNNAFFENFFNVDQQSLYFDATSKIQCQVLINDESYFTGFMRLNRISVKNGSVEYDITLYSTVGDLYGKIGTNLLKDLDFRDVDYHFNHVFTRDNTLASWRYEGLKSAQEVPNNYFYPVMHNGYNYNVSGNTNSVLLTGTTGTSLYTTTKIGSWSSTSAAYSNGVQRYRINSPQDGLRDNQLKPSLNIHSLLQLIFKTYGYTIKSDFFKTPWMKLLYMYGYFSNDSTKFTFKTPKVQTYGLDGVSLLFVDNPTGDTIAYVVKKDTGTPALCNQTIQYQMNFLNPFFGPLPLYGEIAPETTGVTISRVYPFISGSSPDVGTSKKPLSYLPTEANQVIDIVEESYVDFSQTIDPQIKQIDILSSIAKKFNLIFIPDPEVPNQLIIEPYDYYVGSGEVYDWTDKMSWDKGFTVEPAQNFVESEIVLTDLEDGDSGNKDFKDSNTRIYGENIVTNPTEFKSQKKEIKTTLSPQIFRKWNPNNNPGIDSTAVGIPLGINYTEQSQEITSSTGTNASVVDWVYKGVKTKPKLFYNLGNFSPFLDNYGEIFSISGITTAYFRISKNDGTLPNGSLISPVVSNTMPLGNPDNNKINNDSICILFDSEEPTTIAGDSVSLFDAYTTQDTYNLFYENRVSNAFDKNTRMLSGFFDIDESDIKTLSPKDLIKINEQYFTWNKVENFNLSSPELTKVELIQVNYNTRQYPTRYFKYFYCNDPSTIYKFKTEFTSSDSIQGTLYYWSILYDYFCGALGASNTNQITGYTSSFAVGTSGYLPYTIYEVTENDYNSSGTVYIDDPQRYYFLSYVDEDPVGTIYNQNNQIWLINSGQTKATLNVFSNCTQFSNTALSLGVNVLSGTTSQYNTGVQILVTDTGWIRYNTSTYPDGYDQYFGSTGYYTLSGCVDCDSIRYAYPLYDLGSWTTITCGTPC